MSHTMFNVSPPAPRGRRGRLVVVLLAAIDVVCAGGIALTAPAHRPSALIPTDDYLFPLSLPPEGDESAVAPRSAGGSDQLEHTR